MAKNKNLNDAAKAKKDKFYTQLEDIEHELHHYKNFFKGKIVLCNCDDPIESQFFFHFAMLFNHYELKNSIITSYADSPIMGDLFNPPQGKAAYKLEVNEFKDWNGDGAEDWADIEYALEHGIYKCEELHGDGTYCAGDFRSKECIQLLKRADVVVTNPPFSVFREFVAMLIDYDKKFLIIGNMNAVTYKEIFPLIKNDKIWLGHGFPGMVGFFRSPYEDFANASEHREGMIRNSGVHWFTNIRTSKFEDTIPLFREYYKTPEMFPPYDNYDAIEVSRTDDIPEDYFGVMGVPITFLDKYNPKQFEILGATESEGTGFSNGLWHDDSQFRQAAINGKKVYKRIFIRRRQE